MNPLTMNPAIAVMYARQHEAEITARSRMQRAARLAGHVERPRTVPPRRRLRVRRWAYALRLRVVPH